MGNTTLQWLGQAFFKITTSNGTVIYIDPWKDFPPGNNLFPKDVSLEDADVILVTHGHLDHLGDTVRLAKESKKSNLKVISNFEIMIYLMEQGINNEQLQATNKGGTTTVKDINFTLVDAAHSSGIGGFEPKHLINGGEAGGFIIKLEDGLTIYHAGDTDVFSDMELIAQRFHPDVALLPIGGVFTMDEESAAMAVEMIKPKLVIPMHYSGSFKLPGDPEKFKKIIETTNKSVNVIIAKPGETININEHTNATNR
jgi:L-ascorbate metabolism protein UlaG (beta-lactamase superfamily)